MSFCNDKENDMKPLADAVSIKLPNFWSAQPKVWFNQVEAQFFIRGIKQDETKFFHVIAALDQETALRIPDLLEDPPAENKYNSIKNRLIGTFGLSETERAARLLSFSELGDRKPSALMDEMLALLGNHQPCFLFNYLFLRHLPENLRTQLASRTFNSPRELAETADVLWLARDIGHNNMLCEIADVNKVYTKGIRHNDNKKYDICFYHYRFGKKAKKCIEPCQFSGNLEAGRQ